MSHGAGDCNWDVSVHVHGLFHAVLVHVQAALEAERLALKARLKDALRLHMTPCTRLDTSSPIDHTVFILDGLLEVRTHPSSTLLIPCKMAVHSGSKSVGLVMSPA